MLSFVRWTPNITNIPYYLLTPFKNHRRIIRVLKYFSTIEGMSFLKIKNEGLECIGKKMSRGIQFILLRIFLL